VQKLLGEGNSVEEKKYILNADIVRIFALFAVVGIHLLNPIYSRPDFFNGTFWWLTFALNCLFRVSVPLFVMLSGYLVLPKEATLTENLHRAWKRIVVPLLSFYFIGYVYNLTTAYLRQEPFDYSSLVHNLSKNGYSYLYFLVILAFLYVLIPFFQAVLQKKDRQLTAYVIIFFFLNGLVATFARYFSLRVGDVFNTYTTWVLWVGYFLLGYWIREHLPDLGKYTKQLLALFGLGYVVTLVWTYWSYFLHWRGEDIFYIGFQSYPEEYLSIGVTVMSISLFILAMGTTRFSQFFHSITAKHRLQWWAQISFGVYLVHPLVIDFLHRFCGVTADSPLMPNITVYVLVSATLTFGISICLSALLNKLPYFKAVVGK